MNKKCRIALGCMSSAYGVAAICLILLSGEANAQDNAGSATNFRLHGPGLRGLCEEHGRLFQVGRVRVDEEFLRPGGSAFAGRSSLQIRSHGAPAGQAVDPLSGEALEASAGADGRLSIRIPRLDSCKLVWIPNADPSSLSGRFVVKSK